MNIYILLFLLIAVCVALILAFINSFYMDLKGATVDAERFLEKSDIWISDGAPIEFVVDAEFFIQYLGVLKSIFHVGEFGLTVVGITLYFAALIFIFTRFKGVAHSFGATLLISMCFFSPSVLLRISALLREPYCIFFGILSIWYATKFIDRKDLFSLVLFVFFAMVAGFFHKAYLAFFPVLLLLVIFFSIKKSALSFVTALAVMGLLIVFALYAVPQFSSLRGGDALVAVTSGDLSGAQEIVNQKTGRSARTTYDYGADFTSLQSVVVSVVKANIYYYAAPFPWGMTSKLDLLVFVENTVRFLCLVYVLYLVLRSGRKDAFFVLCCYLLLNTIWAVGTSNYGTGSRHHMTTLPLLVLAYSLSQIGSFEVRKCSSVQPIGSVN